MIQKLDVVIHTSYFLFDLHVKTAYFADLQVFGLVSKHLQPQRPKRGLNTPLTKNRR